MSILEQHGHARDRTSPDRIFVEMIEAPDHPWFVACQFHPELKSKPFAPHPLFVAFVRASLEHQARRLAADVAAAAPSAEPSEDREAHTIE